MKPKKIGTVTTIDAQTGEVLRVERNAMTLLPPPDGVCAECGVDHEFEQPHNQQSTYYRMQFYSTHARWPTWSDAMAHCPPAIQELWREELVKMMRENGLPIPEDLQASVAITWRR